jgi:hypothetical protein
MRSHHHHHFRAITDSKKRMPRGPRIETRTLTLRKSDASCASGVELLDRFGKRCESGR